MFRFLLSPNGRVSRGGIWVFTGAMFAAMVASMAIDHVLGTGGFGEDSGLVEMIVSLLLFWPSIAVSIKRFHDRNMTGWWCLILMILMIAAGLAGVFIGVAMGAELGDIETMSNAELLVAVWPAFVGMGLVGLYWFVVQMVLPGTRGDNKYGPDPLV